MIKKLERIIVGLEGDLQTSRPPNLEEQMHKINEIVQVVNQISKDVRNLELSKMLKGF